jgi:signal transduction histidine kinase
MIRHSIMNRQMMNRKTMNRSASITRRLTLAVLLIESLAAIVLIAAVTNHERSVRFETFEANLRATANALLGAVQEGDANEGSVMLDLRSVQIPRRGIYRVTIENGKVLGSRGELPPFPIAADTFTEARIGDHDYRFYVLEGERVVDPGRPNAVNHHVRVIFGLPEGRTWGAIFAATRYFVIATVVLLGITAVLLLWLIRRSLLPIRDLAHEAGKVDADHWAFHAPPASWRFTELRPLASALETALARLQRSFEQQRRFSSDAAHELKTDLAIIKSSIQLLGMKRRTVEEYEQGLVLGLEDIARMETTVRKMLTLARLEQSSENEPQTSSLAAAVEEAIVQSKPFAQLRQVSVMQESPDFEAMIPLSHEDAVLLCANPLINALQHSSPNGVVHVTTMREAGTVTLRIRDHGEGIREEDRLFLFDAFYRGDLSRSRKSGGTGLGLSICKAICSRASGTITIANHPEGGAVVEIRLPIFSANSPAT